MGGEPPSKGSPTMLLLRRMGLQPSGAPGQSIASRQGQRRSAGGGVHRPLEETRTAPGVVAHEALGPLQVGLHGKGQQRKRHGNQRQQRDVNDGQPDLGPGLQQRPHWVAGNEESSRDEDHGDLRPQDKVSHYPVAPDGGCPEEREDEAQPPHVCWVHPPEPALFQGFWHPNGSEGGRGNGAGPRRGDDWPKHFPRVPGVGPPTAEDEPEDEQGPCEAGHHVEDSLPNNKA
mmetsp:Transcript_12240/g.34424  ORF Transcript_12240/g.34424 Transcript_12240/m.34424 type:complete len:231 (+) Transcript_12240:289-981(+)